MSFKSLSLIAAAALLLFAGASRALDGVAPGPTGLPTDLGTPRTLGSAAGAASAPRSIESQLRELQSTNEFQRRALSQLHERVAAAEDAAAWLPWLGCGLVGTVALSGWLAFSLVRTQRLLRHEQDSRMPMAPPHTAVPVNLRGMGGAADAATAEAGWQPPHHGAPSEPPSTAAGLAAITDPHLADTRPLMAARVMPPAPAPAAPVAPASSPATATRPFMGNEAGAAMAPGPGGRPVSVEELLDLEQQVDFFMVLGQQDAAIDLLVGHIRATGGTSPLPYLKLLEIYHAQGNADDYERTRSRFNQRFSAEAPAWGSALDEGRGLEQYAEVLTRLQALWPLHDDAVRELDMLMRLSERGRRFDLPAFRDLLLLHGVAGDLAARPSASASTGAASASDVDILLPLTEEPADVTAPQPHVSSQPLGLQMLMPRPPQDLLAEPPAAPGSPASASAVAAAPAAVPQTWGNLPASASLAASVAAAAPAGLGPSLSADAGAGSSVLPQAARSAVVEAAVSSAVEALDALAAVRSRLPLPDVSDVALGDEATMVFERPLKLDLDLSEFGPAPRDYTQPAAFTDINLVRQTAAAEAGLGAVGATPALQAGGGKA